MTDKLSKSGKQALINLQEQSYTGSQLIPTTGAEKTEVHSIASLMHRTCPSTPLWIQIYRALLSVGEHAIEISDGQEVRGAARVLAKILTLGRGARYRLRSSFLVLLELQQTAIMLQDFV